MAMPAFPRCECTDCNLADVSVREIFQAASLGDLDRAIDAGLLRWNGCIACAIADGLSHSDVEHAVAARDARIDALAARERYRARTRRVQHRIEQRDARRSVIDSTAASSLPSAAAEALARAKAKAARRT